MMDNQEKDVVIFKKELEGDIVELTKGMFAGYSNEMITEVMRLYENDAKRQSRKKRCLNPNGTRCWDKKCSECSRMKDGLPLSLDQRMDEGVFPEDNFSVEECVEKRELHHALHTAFKSLGEKDLWILHLIFWDEQPERKAGKAIGISQSTVNYRKEKAICILRELLKDFR